MTAQNAAIVVQLIDHHVAQVFKQALPLGVVRQDARVQHVGIGDHQIAAGADGLARVLRRVAVVGEGAHFVAELFGPAIELHELVLRKGLGGEKIKGARFGVLDQLAQDRQVVAQRFARRRRRDHHQVLALASQGEGQRLVRVERGETASLQNLRQARRQGGREEAPRAVREQGSGGWPSPRLGRARRGTSPRFP